MDLKSIIAYDSNTGEFVRKTSRRSDKIGQRAGTVGKNGYVYINVGKKIYLAHRLAWLYVYGVDPQGHIDHVNRDRSDNRIANLRECPTKQAGNGQNVTRRKDNSSGFTGVHYFKRTGKWQAYITVEGQRHNLGYFSSAEEAAAAYAIAKAEYHVFHSEVIYG